MSREFRSTRAALGYACSVQGHQGCLASVSDARGGQPPDHALASSVLACLKRAGLDPHADTPLLRAVISLATDGEALELDEQLAGKLDAVLVRLATQLLQARIVVHRAALPGVTWRAVRYGVAVHYHASSEDDGAVDLAALKRRILDGLEQPEQAGPCPTTREALLERCSAGYIAGTMTTTEIDEQLAAVLDVCPRRARQIRRDDLKITAKRGGQREITLDKHQCLTDC